MATATLPLVDGGAPVIGHLAQFFRDPVAVLRRGYHTRGKLFSFKLMGRRMNVMLGPEHNRFFFEETDKLLSIRESMPFFLKMFSPDFYSFAEMDEYLRQRAIIMPRFKAASMKQYVGIMAEESLNLVARLGDEGEFDMIPTLGPVVMDIAAHSFMGREFHEKLGHEFFELFRDFSAGMEFVLPLWLPTPKQVRSQRAKKKLHAILQAWIEKRRAAPLDPPDFFQTMIETRYPDGRPVPDETIRHLILLLVWAGHETTAGQVSWALADLLQNRDYQAVIRAELAAVLGARWLLWRTRFGLRLRIAGEHPLAGESLGVNIIRQKYIAVAISGALAGLGGAFMSMELSGFFQEGQTGGRGFIGLAALIFGNWRPLGVLMAALLFAYPFGMSRLDLDGTSSHALMLVVAFGLALVAVWAFTKGRRIHATVAAVLSLGVLVWYLSADTAPKWFTNTLPYLLVLLVLVFAAQRLRPPKAAGHVYRKGGT